MSANAWRDTKPPRNKHVWVWWGSVEIRAYWSGSVWWSVTSGAILHDVTHWREIDE